MTTVSVNIPFITGRCDFYGRNLYANTAPAVKHAYLDALLCEARALAADLDGEVDCVAFENGAIGTIEPAKLRDFLAELKGILPMSADCHVSAEADCGLMSTATMEELKTFGIKTLRFHYLTSDPIESEWLSRACSVGEMAKTRIVMESAGFSNFDMQILIGLAGQSEKTLLKTLRESVLSGDVRHCTLLAAAGDVAADASQACAMFDVAKNFLLEHGFVQYAPTCFAKPGYELAVEARRKGDDFVSLGPSSVSRLDDVMWANSGDVDAYISSKADPETITQAAVELDDTMLKAQEIIGALWAMQACDLGSCAADLGDFVSDGRLTITGCMNFDEVARRIVAAECAVAE